MGRRENVSFLGQARKKETQKTKLLSPHHRHSHHPARHHDDMQRTQPSRHPLPLPASPVPFGAKKRCKKVTSVHTQCGRASVAGWPVGPSQKRRAPEERLHFSPALSPTLPASTTSVLYFTGDNLLLLLRGHLASQNKWGTHFIKWPGNVVRPKRRPRL